MKSRAVYIRNLSSLSPCGRKIFFYTATLVVGSKQIRSAVHNRSADKQNNHSLHVTPKKLYDANLSPQKKLI